MRNGDEKQKHCFVLSIYFSDNNTNSYLQRSKNQIVTDCEINEVLPCVNVQHFITVLIQKQKGDTHLNISPLSSFSIEVKNLPPTRTCGKYFFLNNDVPHHALAVIKMDSFISRGHLIGWQTDTPLIPQTELYK